MGKKIHAESIEALIYKSPVVSYASISRMLRSKKKTSKYSKMLVHNLLAKGKIKRLAKGCYTSHDDTTLAVFCFQPSYIGLQDAMSFHNIWEQETIPVIITARKVRPGIRVVMEKNILIRRIEKKYMFGIEYHRQDLIEPMHGLPEGQSFQSGSNRHAPSSAAIPYSDMEKTFLDMMYFKEKLDKDAISAFRKKMDKTKLRAYLKRYSKTVQKAAVKIIDL